MTAEGLVAAVLDRIKPGPRREVGNARDHAVAELGRRQAGPALIEDSHEIAIGDATRRRILRVQADDLAAVPLGRLAVGPEIELAVQPRRRLVGDQRQRRRRIRLLSGGKPGRMARAIVIAEASDGLAEDLDPPARRRQGATVGIVAESAQQPAIVRCGG